MKKLKLKIYNQTIDLNKLIDGLKKGQRRFKVGNKWITINPSHKEGAGHPLFVEEGETVKQAIERKYGKEFKVEKGDSKRTQRQKNAIIDAMDTMKIPRGGDWDKRKDTIKEKLQDAKYYDNAISLLSHTYSLLKHDKNANKSSTVQEFFERVDGELGNMIDEVNEAEAGKRWSSGYGTEFQFHAMKSTFPQWFRDLGMTSKENFMSMMRNANTTGGKFNRVFAYAIEQVFLLDRTREEAIATVLAILPSMLRGEKPDNYEEVNQREYMDMLLGMADDDEELIWSRRSVGGLKPEEKQNDNDDDLPF